FNEISTIESLIQSLKNQSLVPDEIIIVDGGSTDGTWENLKKQTGLKAFLKSGNRSVGRNFAISKSRGNIIAMTDAGCIPGSRWLEELVHPMKSPEVKIVSGYYQGVAKNVFQKCLIPFVLVMPDKAGKSEFYPSTRSMAIRKEVFITSGGFDEKLWHNEDYAYAHRLKRQGFNFTFAPHAIVDWLPRQNLRESAWMFTRFALGDIQAGIFRPQVKRLAIRYLIAVYLFFLALEIRLLFIPLLVLFIFYILFSIIKNYKYVRDPLAFFWFPILQITSDLSIIFGSLIGLLSKAYGLF
ncbi:hypothetical protein A3D85_01595, partial [Candidatus Amesbacteria bacterium RIFCSPHIGHO2_02_FULL_47_9]